MPLTIFYWKKILWMFCSRSCFGMHKNKFLYFNDNSFNRVKWIEFRLVTHKCKGTFTQPSANSTRDQQKLWHLLALTPILNKLTHHWRYSIMSTVVWTYNIYFWCGKYFITLTVAILSLSHLLEMEPETWQ